MYTHIKLNLSNWFHIFYKPLFYLCGIMLERIQMNHHNQVNVNIIFSDSMGLFFFQYKDYIGRLSFLYRIL